MPKKIAGSFINLVHEATLKSFWRRNALWRFLRQQGIADSFLATWEESESKRDFLDRLFMKIPSAPEGQRLILGMAQDLAAQDSFPDLMGWEDSSQLLQNARSAVANLKSALARLNKEVVLERDRQESQARVQKLYEESAQSRSNLDSLGARLGKLATSLGTQQAGYDFQDWFYDLVAHFEVVFRRPYITAGRQIDGSITVSGTTYLIETKFTRDQAAAEDIDSFFKKVTEKADNTMGVMVSISGYSAVAIAEASKPKTPLLLLDHGHLYHVLGGIATLPEVIERIRRHASQTSESYLPASLLNC